MASPTVFTEPKVTFTPKGGRKIRMEFCHISRKTYVMIVGKEGMKVEQDKMRVEIEHDRVEMKVGEDNEGGSDRDVEVEMMVLEMTGLGEEVMEVGRKIGVEKGMLEEIVAKVDVVERKMAKIERRERVEENRRIWSFNSERRLRDTLMRMSRNLVSYIQIDDS
jgi:hypothetical protein